MRVSLGAAAGDCAVGTGTAAGGVVAVAVPGSVVSDTARASAAPVAAVRHIRPVEMRNGNPLAGGTGGTHTGGAAAAPSAPTG